MMGVSSAPQYTSLSNMAEDIQKILNAYRDEVLGGIANGVQEGAEYFISEVKKVSPYDDENETTPHYKDSWEIKKMSKAKYVRYVGNTKKVKAHSKDTAPTIPLINILEFSSNPNKHRPHVGTAVESSKSQILELIIRKI